MEDQDFDTGQQMTGVLCLEGGFPIAPLDPFSHHMFNYLKNLDYFEKSA